MPGKIARSDPRPSFGLPELLVASHISRLASRDAAKSLLSTLVSESSGECRFIILSPQYLGGSINVGPPSFCPAFVHGPSLRFVLVLDSSPAPLPLAIGNTVAALGKGLRQADHAENGRNQ